ncbi:MAG: hypothetical protein ACI4HL_00860 [Ruminococcus sp.]
MDRREKKPISPKGRKFNIILTVVALILVVAVGGVTTYSWIEQNTNMNLHMNEGNIKDTPESYNVYYHSVNVGKDEDDETSISLNKFADLADGITLSQLSSKDGENFFYHKSGNSYKKLDVNDKSVSYIAFDLDVNSTCDDTTKFFFDEEVLRFVYGNDDDKVANSLRMSVKVTPEGGTSTTTIFSPTGNSYEAITSSTGETDTVTTKAFGACLSEDKPIFTLSGNSKANVEIAIWLEGNLSSTDEDNDDTKITQNAQLNVLFQIDTNWYKASDRYLYIYDGTTEQFMSDCDTGTYTVYDSNDNVIGSEDKALLNFYDGNNCIKRTAIISDMANATKVVFKFNKQKSGETLSHTYVWNTSDRTSTEIYYTITGYTKDSE